MRECEYKGKGGGSESAWATVFGVLRGGKHGTNACIFTRKWRGFIFEAGAKTKRKGGKETIES